jgi:hypothetical protein
MSKSSSSLSGGRHKLPLAALAAIYQTDEWSFCRPCGLPDRFLFSLRCERFFRGYLLPTDSQTAGARNDRDRINRTRQNAEGLFKPKQQSTREDIPTSAPNDASSAEHQPRRQPRIFTIPPMAPMTTAKVKPAVEPKQIRRAAAIGRETRQIPASQFGRVRALTN